MTPAVVLDIVLILALAAYAAAMYRVGLVAGALSIVGLLGGGVLALWGLPLLLQKWPAVNEDPMLTGLLLVVGTVVAALVGQRIGGRLGARLRSSVSFRPARAIDSVLGAAGALAVGASLVWLAAGALVGGSQGPAPSAVTDSRVLQGIDGVMPAGADRVVSGAYRSLDANGFPRVFAGVSPEEIRPVSPPEPGLAQGRGVAAAADSVVKVTGFAGGCGRGQSGSGWVAAPERVVTNAHVVAGVDRPSVQIGGEGRTYSATTVAFDARRDVAVLAVPELEAQSLPSGGQQSHGADVVVAGFPLGGPYDLESGRVRDILTARGAAIDGSSGVTREVYSINAQVEQGNSGGPLLSPTGQVVGTVFAKSQTDATTGYALTLDETRPVIEQGTQATGSVSTGSCAA